MTEDSNSQETLEATNLEYPDTVTEDLQESDLSESTIPADLDDPALTPGSEPLENLSDVEVAAELDEASPPETQDSLPSDSPETEADPDALAQLAMEVESLRSQVDERTSQYMRICADFENFRKRTSREKSELEVRVKRDTLSELLPVIDSFERARSHIQPQNEAEETIHNSYQGIYKQLVDCLKRIGVAPMRAQGQPFDPNFHEAVMREPTTEFEEGTVMEELVSGYILGEQVLRHAMVKVAAPSEDSSPSINSEAEGPENTVSE
ncbi:MAG: nucleotide exchange factor GrpE [Acaryochloridaceae cyanobacterium SU_2_1]|nr:nucleotide exchange factor GrpE [Acaryochloridaceae cyanobacterium SU_2_1]